MATVKAKKAKKSRGRKSGGRNRGYWYLKGRGWVVSEHGTRAALTDKAGNQIRNPSVARDELDDAYRRYRQEREQAERQRVDGDTTPISEVCGLFLEHDKKTNKTETYNIRRQYLFDFCSGFPFRYLDSKEKPPASDRIHKGYGGMPTGDLRKLDVEQWVNAHAGWTKGGAARVALQSLKAALNYGVEAGLLSKSPIKGMKVDKGEARVTYFSPEQESAMLKHASPAFALALRVLIRTGARPGIEFAKLTDKHVVETPKGQEWHFTVKENKTGTKTRKQRIIRVPSEIAEIVREQLKRHPHGFVFQNNMSRPWTVKLLSCAFRRLKLRLAKHGVTLDADACLYSTRHTYAKRVLGGYWTGTPTSIETLAGLMGNSPKICWDHYAQWHEGFTDPLWKALG